MTEYTMFKRKSDTEAVAAQNIAKRSERFFTQHNYWYFSTREGFDIGPFSTMLEATQGLDGFIAFLQEADPEVVNRISRYVTDQVA